MMKEEIGIRERMLVREVMTSPVITVDGKTSADKVAQMMDKYKVSSVVVAVDDSQPLGIITERDLVTRILTKNIQPATMIAEEVMSSPLIMVSPDENLSDSARRMSRLGIRRLGVVYKGKLVGIVASSDILAVVPELLNIMKEKAKINEEIDEVVEEVAPLSGDCHQCNRWSDDLKEVDGDFLCEECRTDLENP